MTARRWQRLHGAARAVRLAEEARLGRTLAAERAARAEAAAWERRLQAPDAAPDTLQDGTDLAAGHAWTAAQHRIARTALASALAEAGAQADRAAALRHGLARAHARERLAADLAARAGRQGARRKASDDPESAA